MTLGFETQKPIEIGGIKYTRIGEQLTRKAASVLQQKGKSIGPPERRAPKDIGDFMDISSELLESRSKTAKSAWLLSEYKTRKVEHLAEMRHQYEFHSYLGPEVAPVVRGYYGLPRTIRAPGYMVAAVGIGAKYPGVAEYSPTKYPAVAKLPPTKYPSIKYPSTKYPAVAKIPPTKYPSGYKPYRPPSAPYEPYAKTTAYPPSVPPYTPPYTPPTAYTPAVPPYIPPYVPPTVIPSILPPLLPPTKPPMISPKKKAKKKIKPPKPKPEMAVGWKQKHEIITLADFLGYSP